MNFIEIFKIIVSLVPLLIQAIKAVEEAIPGQGAGEMKLAAVREMLEAASTFAGDTLDDIWPAIEKVIGSLVNLFNGTKVFSK